MGSSVEKMRVAAPAKINLFLNVTGRREDGLHLLHSLVAFAEIGDGLTVQRDAESRLSIDGPFATDLNANDNIVLRAARALRPAAGARLRLTKNLPVASGLGGGSSDAAAALRLLARLWEIHPSDLPALGLELGADVPACLAARTALVSGIGEIVEPVAPLPDCGVVLANAGAPVSTAAVFAARKGEFSAPADWHSPRDLHELVARLGTFGNGLFDAAVSIAPIIADVLDSLERDPSCLLARMSGSGGACFALFPDLTAATEAARALKADHPLWWVAASRFRSRPPGIQALRRPFPS